MQNSRVLVPCEQINQMVVLIEINKNENRRLKPTLSKIQVTLKIKIKNKKKQVTIFSAVVGV